MTARWLHLFFVFCLAICSALPGSVRGQPTTPMRILFIGNSATYYNDMPSTVAAMSRASGGRPATVAQVVWDGSTLENHWRLGTALSEVRKGGWAFVVLQEQTARPIRDRAAMVEYVRKFDDEIRAVGARTVLFVTWARRSAPDSQQVVNEVYAEAAKGTGALIAPVGARRGRGGASQRPLKAIKTDKTNDV